MLPLLLSTNSYRECVPSHSLLEDSIIKQAIYLTQHGFLTELLTYDYVTTLEANLLAEQLTPVQVQLLNMLKWPFAYYTAATLAENIKRGIFPIHLKDANPACVKESSQHWRQLGNQFLKPIYTFCAANSIPCNKVNSVSACPIFLGGSDSSNTSCGCTNKKPEDPTTDFLNVYSYSGPYASTNPSRFTSASIGTPTKLPSVSVPIKPGKDCFVYIYVPSRTSVVVTSAMFEQPLEKVGTTSLPISLYSVEAYDIYQIGIAAKQGQLVDYLTFTLS